MSNPYCAKCIKPGINNPRHIPIIALDEIIMAFKSHFFLTIEENSQCKVGNMSICGYEKDADHFHCLEWGSLSKGTDVLS